MSSLDSPARPLLMATDTESMRSLAASLEADRVSLPSPAEPDAFQVWRNRAEEGPTYDSVLVSLWNEESSPTPLVEIDAAQWKQRFEGPYLLWNMALGVAARRCRDDGAIVALVQTPAALDAHGFSVEMGIADGVTALMRSLAASEGPRGVRANVVTTPLGIVDRARVLPPPPLDVFPGRIEVEVAGTIRLLASAAARGLTGRVLAADGGRSLS